MNTTNQIDIRVVGGVAYTSFNWQRDTVNFTNITDDKVKTQQAITNDRRANGQGRNMFPEGTVISPGKNKVQRIPMVNGSEGNFFTYRMVLNGTREPENGIVFVIDDSSQLKNQLTITSALIGDRRFFMPAFRNNTGDITFSADPESLGIGSVTVDMEDRTLTLTKESPVDVITGLVKGRYHYTLSYSENNVVSTTNNFGEIDVDEPPDGSVDPA